MPTPFRCPVTGEPSITRCMAHAGVEPGRWPVTTAWIVGMAEPCCHVCGPIVATRSGWRTVMVNVRHVSGQSSQSVWSTWSVTPIVTS